MLVHPEYQGIQKVLIVCTSWLGDTVITIPTIYGIRSIFPQAHISVLAKDANADILRAVPATDEVICFHKKKGVEKLSALVSTARTLKKKAFDLAIIFPRSLGTALMCFLARVPRRVGFNSSIRGIFLTEILQRDSDILSVHQVHYYKKLLEPIGNAQFPELPSLILPEIERKWAREFLFSKRSDSCTFTIGLNPGSTYGDAKQWLPERFEELSRKLIEKHGCEIIIFGDSDTGTLAKKISAGLDGRVVDATGRTSILQLAALVQCCDVLVTNDTGPMHVACAVGTPVVAVFGSTDPVTTSPLGPDSVIVRVNIPCSPCLKRTCPEGHHRCMHAVTVDDVEDAVLEQLKKKGKNTTSTVTRNS